MGKGGNRFARVGVCWGVDPVDGILSRCVKFVRSKFMEQNSMFVDVFCQVK